MSKGSPKRQNTKPKSKHRKPKPQISKFSFQPRPLNKTSKACLKGYPKGKSQHFHPNPQGGGVNFQWETALQTSQKPPDFLYFDLTDPMVPNLANVFYWVGSQRQFREENEAKMAILSYFGIFVQVSNLSYILPSKYYANKSSGNCLYLY